MNLIIGDTEKTIKRPERIVRGLPESRWNCFAIGRSLLDRIKSICDPYPGWFLEFGSGVGTRRLAADFKVMTVEHDPDWIIYPHGTTNIYQLLAPLSRGWYHARIVEEALASLYRNVPKSKFVGVLIDGPPSLIGREGILRQLDWLAPYLDCPIFVDDTHREPEQSLAHAIARKLGRAPELIVHHYTEPDKKGSESLIILK